MLLDSSNPALQGIDKRTPLIIGFSGGADSTALLHLLYTSGYNCIAAHCNFHLRGTESDRDMQAAQKFAQSLNIPFLLKHFDVTGFQKSNGGSLEMACRQLRYDWWRELIGSGKGKFIVVAHHQDDNIETLLINLLRGTGITGLKGMLPRSGNILRPLLNFSRAEIEEYCLENHLPFVVDSTNLENDYTRNKIRNLILPQIEHSFPQARRGIALTIENLRQNYEIFSGNIAWMKEKAFNDSGSVDVSKFSTINELFEALRPLGFTYSQAHDIFSSQKKSGLIFETSQGKHILSSGILEPYNSFKAPSLKSSCLQDLNISVEHHSIDDFQKLVKICEPGKSIFLDKSALDNNPIWEWRNWQKGDRFTPFGMKGSKLVSDLLTDNHLSLNQKQETRILTRNDEILWVFPLRASNHFRVRGNDFIILTPLLK